MLKKGDSMLFEDFAQIQDDYLSNRAWVSRFLRTKYIWQHKAYIYACAVGCIQSDTMVLNVFCGRIKQYYNHYVLKEKLYTEDELRDVLVVMIQNGIFLNRANIENTYRHIQQGFYREYLEQAHKNHATEEQKEDEISKLAQSIDWEDF